MGVLAESRLPELPRRGEACEPAGPGNQGQGCRGAGACTASVRVHSPEAGEPTPPRARTLAWLPFAEGREGPCQVQRERVLEAGRLASWGRDTGPRSSAHREAPRSAGTPCPRAGGLTSCPSPGLSQHPPRAALSPRSGSAAQVAEARRGAGRRVQAAPGSVQGSPGPDAVS